MDYYRNQITEQSWQTLQKLSKDHACVLIGGWAVWLHTHALKSKDIDIIVDHPTLGKLKTSYDVYKNIRLRKYEIVIGPVDIDIYISHWSELGFPIEQIMDHTTVLQGFTVPRPEVLLVLKQIAYSSRIGSAKGRKDLLDILSLLQCPCIDWDLYHSLFQARTKPAAPLSVVIASLVDAPELSLNRHVFAKLKKDWLKHV